MPVAVIGPAGASLAESRQLSAGMRLQDFHRTTKMVAGLAAEARLKIALEPAVDLHPEGIEAFAHHPQHLAKGRNCLDGKLAIFGGIANILGRGALNLRESLFQSENHFASLVKAERGLREIGNLRRVRDLQPFDVIHVANQKDVFRRFAHRSDSLLVILVADERDRVTLLCEADGLHVHLGYQGAGSIDHTQLAKFCFLANLW